MINVSNLENLLYSVDLKNKKTFISNDFLGKKSPFSECVGVKTDEFTDDFIGAVAYYTNPEIAVIIAGFCQGCVKHWWSQGCPK